MIYKVGLKNSMQISFLSRCSELNEGPVNLNPGENQVPANFNPGQGNLHPVNQANPGQGEESRLHVTINNNFPVNNQAPSYGLIYNPQKKLNHTFFDELSIEVVSSLLYFGVSFSTLLLRRQIIRVCDIVNDFNPKKVILFIAILIVFPCIICSFFNLSLLLKRIINCIGWICVVLSVILCWEIYKEKKNNPDSKLIDNQNLILLFIFFGILLSCFNVTQGKIPWSAVGLFLFVMLVIFRDKMPDDTFYQELLLFLLLLLFPNISENVWPMFKIILSMLFWFLNFAIVAYYPEIVFMSLQTLLKALVIIFPSLASRFDSFKSKVNSLNKTN
jgi:hypothetical protein